MDARDCHQAGPYGAFLGQNAAPPTPFPLPAFCLQKNLNPPGLAQVPKSKFNQRREKMQKKEKQSSKTK